MLFWRTLGMRPSTPAEYGVLGCLGFFFFLGVGLIGLGFLLIHRFRSGPHAQEGGLLVGSLVCLVIAGAIPLGKRIAEHLHGD